MRFAFVIFKYFPYGGAQRDMLRIAQACMMRGHVVDVYVMSWDGPQPEAGIRVRLVPARGWVNYRRYQDFIDRVHARVARERYDLVVGFNRMSGLDAYFAADSCFVGRKRGWAGWLHRISPRHRWFARCEASVFGEDAAVRILLLSEAEKAVFQRGYGTPDARFHLLPPHLSAERMALQDIAGMRARLRGEFGFAEDDPVLLLVGSGFRTKGLDRAIRGLAALPPDLRARVRLIAAGQDNARPYLRLAEKLRVAPQVRVVAGRSDIPQLMQGADVLVHPARRELAGHVLLESMASGLPVLATDVCGYSPHVAAAGAGIVLSSPFDQAAFDRTLAGMLTSPSRPDWRSRGIAYAQRIMAVNDGTAEARMLETMAAERHAGNDAVAL